MIAISKSNVTNHPKMYTTFERLAFSFSHQPSERMPLISKTILLARLIHTMFTANSNPAPVM